MTPTPTPEAIEALALELAKFHRPSADAALRNEYADARWILSRFVRREKHERLLAHIESSHNEVVCSSADRHAKDGNDPLPRLTCMTWDAHRLRTELHGQRCGGDGTLRGVRPGSMIGESEWIRCPSCPACTPEVTPKRVSPFCPECGAESPNGHFEKCSHSRPPQATPKGDGHEHLWISTSWGRPRCEKCGKWATDDRSRDSDGVAWCEMCEAYRKAGCVRCDKCGSIVDGTGVSPTQVDELRAGSLPAAPVPIVTPESMSLLEHHCSDADFETIAKLRDESYAAGYQAGRDDAANGLGVQLVELGPATLRALATLLTDRGGEKLLAMLGETKP